jgi:hypothetical protein
MPTEYKSEEEALKDIASILEIPCEDLKNKGPNMFEDFGKPRWLDIYDVPRNRFGVDRLGVGYYRQGYKDGGPRPMFGLWLIDVENNINQV